MGGKQQGLWGSPLCRHPPVAGSSGTQASPALPLAAASQLKVTVPRVFPSRANRGDVGAIGAHSPSGHQAAEGLSWLRPIPVLQSLVCAPESRWRTASSPKLSVLLSVLAVWPAGPAVPLCPRDSEGLGQCGCFTFELLCSCPSKVALAGQSGAGTPDGSQGLQSSACPSTPAVAYKTASCQDRSWAAHLPGLVSAIRASACFLWVLSETPQSAGWSSPAFPVHQLKPPRHAPEDSPPVRSLVLEPAQMPPL